MNARFFLFLAAIILFVVSALILFFLDASDVSFRTTLGLLAAGLACVAAALTPVPQHTT
jgi:hypothetical protein